MLRKLYEKGLLKEKAIKALKELELEEQDLFEKPFESFVKYENEKRELAEIWF